MPVKSFEGEIHLIETVEAACQAAEYLRRQAVLGFDTETKPAFKKGQKNKVALLQLATEEEAYLFRLHYTGIPECLQEILASEHIIKVGAAITDDLKALRKREDLPPAGFVDLQRLVRSYGIESLSLQKMAAIVLNFKISKRQQVTNWEAETLSEAQLLYAATDAWVGYKIFSRMRQRLGEHFAYTTQRFG